MLKRGDPTGGRTRNGADDSETLFPQSLHEARFEFEQALGPRFVARVLPDSAANPEPPAFYKQVVGTPHSVVTAHLVDEAGQPTRVARDEILQFFRSRLIQA